MEERWKEAAETFELALRMMETPQGGPSALPASVFATLAFALRSYSSQVVRMHKKNQVAMQFMDRKYYISYTDKHLYNLSVNCSSAQCT